MKIIEYTAVAGTGALNRENEWVEPTSKHSIFALKRGLVNSRYRRLPYIWSTDLDVGSGPQNDWRSGGAALAYYEAAGEALANHIISPGVPELNTPGDKTYLLTHSWGGMPALHACAEFGLKVECLVTVGMPIVKQTAALYAKARPNIKRHLHLYCKRDWTQLAGELFDGSFRFSRKVDGADWNDEMPRGHGNVLRDEDLFPLWVERGWFDFITEGKRK